MEAQKVLQRYQKIFSLVKIKTASRTGVQAYAMPSIFAAAIGQSGETCKKLSQRAGLGNGTKYNFKYTQSRRKSQLNLCKLRFSQKSANLL